MEFSELVNPLQNRLVYFPGYSFLERYSFRNKLSQTKASLSRYSFYTNLGDFSPPSQKQKKLR